MSNNDKRQDKHTLQRQEIKAARIEVAAAHLYSGPIPEPAQLREYNDILPGAANRILKMAEDEAHHRRAMDDRLVSNMRISTVMGMVFAFILSFTAISGGIFLTYEGFSATGITVIIGALVSLCTVFVIGRKTNKKPK